MKLVLLGDVFGKPGVRALNALLPPMLRDGEADVAVVNGENSADGLGLTADTARAIMRAGASVITTGNHVWHRRQFLEQINQFTTVARPLNQPPGTPGMGVISLTLPSGIELVVINLIGRLFMAPSDCPFRAVDGALASLPDPPAAGRIIAVDFHAEATSEKQAMGHFLDGRVAVVVGTHTHVQTGDERILPNGTAYISDLGLTGPQDSVIGQNKDQAVNQFLAMRHMGFKPAPGPVGIEGAIVEADPHTGLSSNITRVRRVTAPDAIAMNQ